MKRSRSPLFPPSSPSSIWSDELGTAESGTAESIAPLIDPIDPTRTIQPKKKPQVVIRVKSSQDGDTRSTKRRVIVVAQKSDEPIEVSLNSVTSSAGTMPIISLLFFSQE